MKDCDGNVLNIGDEVIPGASSCLLDCGNRIRIKEISPSGVQFRCDNSRCGATKHLGGRWRKVVETPAVAPLVIGQVKVLESTFDVTARPEKLAEVIAALTPNPAPPDRRASGDMKFGVVHDGDVYLNPEFLYSFIANIAPAPTPNAEVSRLNAMNDRQAETILAQDKQIAAQTKLLEERKRLHDESIALRKEALDLCREKDAEIVELRRPREIVLSGPVFQPIPEGELKQMICRQSYKAIVCRNALISIQKLVSPKNKSRSIHSKRINRIIELAKKKIAEAEKKAVKS